MEEVVGRAFAPWRFSSIVVPAFGAIATEFVTLMWFESIESVRAFAGEQYEVAVVPPAARALLLRFDERSAHYDVRQPRGATLR